MNILYQQTPVHYEVFGSGKPLVLLHGFLWNHTVWKPFIPILTKKHQVISVDLFGHGKTGKVGEIHRMEEIAESISLILEKEDIPATSIIGHSMGGYVALAFAEKYPEKTNRLILLNSTPGADTEERKATRDRAIRMVQQHKEAFIRMAIVNLFNAENKPPKTEIDNIILAATQISTASIIASLKGLKTRKDRTEILKNFKGKKNLIAGEKDELIPFKNSKKIAENTESKFLSFSGGHVSGFYENRDQLKSFFADL